MLSTRSHLQLIPPSVSNLHRIDARFVFWLFKALVFDPFDWWRSPRRSSMSVCSFIGGCCALVVMSCTTVPFSTFSSEFPPTRTDPWCVESCSNCHVTCHMSTCGVLLGIMGDQMDLGEIAMRPFFKISFTTPFCSYFFPSIFLLPFLFRLIHLFLPLPSFSFRFPKIWVFSTS